MRHTIALTFVIPIAALLTQGDLTAQATKVVPAFNTVIEGSTLSVYPFGYTTNRMQQVWSGSSISSNTSLVRGISYRMDTVSRTAAEPGRTYTGVTIAVGTSTVTPATMSTTFATNVTSPLTNVITGNYNLPAQPAPTGQPAPFNVDFSWSTPYIYSPTAGSLILDVTLPGTVGKSNYFVDAEYSTGVPGSAVPFGTSGSFSSSETFALSAAADTLGAGGSLDIQCGTFSKAYLGSLVVGLSDKTWGAVSLPLDLGLIGAPGNSLYVSMNLQFGFNTTSTTPGHVSTFKTAIPNSPIYDGLHLFAQAWYLDANANAAGLVATHGLALNFANPSAGPETNQVGNYDATATSGNLGLGKTGGPVARFTGVF
ncbi:MAG: hypothetical protein H6837_04755 [Planctomycetes bacterium]|nr:hypothetical protein [Planctomycetota bacterium]